MAYTSTSPRIKSNGFLIGVKSIIIVGLGVKHTYKGKKNPTIIRLLLVTCRIIVDIREYDPEKQIGGFSSENSAIFSLFHVSFFSLFPEKITIFLYSSSVFFFIPRQGCSCLLYTSPSPRDS